MIRQPLTVANALYAGTPKLGDSPFDVPIVIDEGGATQQPEEPFVWGAGGTRMTVDQLSAKQAIAADLMKSNYDPVGSVWEGLGRVVDNVSGAFQQRGLNKEAKAQGSQREAIAQALMGGDSAAINAAILSGDPGLGSLGKLAYERANPKQTAPHFWETNDGSLGMVGPDGRPQVLYQDPTPKITTLALDNGDGTKTLVRVGPDGLPIGNAMQGGGGQSSTAGAGLPAIGSVVADPRKQGGGAGNGVSGFR